MELLLLCWEFFKTGLFAIGGGLATIPFLMAMAEKYPHWMSLAELADMIAVSESTPGPVGINMATYVGFKVFGVPGALLATFSLVLPAFVILVIIGKALEKWKESRLVKAGFAGLRPAVTGLIAAAGYSVLRVGLFRDGRLDWLLVLMFAIVFACTQIKGLKKLHPVVYIAAAAAAGVVLKL